MRTASLIALPVDRRLLGELVQPGKSDDVSSPELLGGPRDTNDRPLVTAFLEVGPVHLEARGKALLIILRAHSPLVQHLPYVEPPPRLLEVGLDSGGTRLDQGPIGGASWEG